MDTIHDRIRERRTVLGLTMEALGKKVGVTRQTVQQWENASTAPKRKRLIAVAEALECSPDYLSFGDAATDAKRQAASAELSASQSESLSPDEINARLAELEAVVRAGALQAGVPVERVVGDLRGMRERVRATLTSDAPQRSDRDERGLGQPTPSGEVRFTQAPSSAVNAWGGDERRHSAGRRRSN